MCIVGVLVAILFNRAHFYQRMAEKTAMEETVGALRNALHLKFSELVAQHQENDAQYFVGQNPMNWLSERPNNYAGELFGPEADRVVSGQWYFDLRDRRLVYLVHTQGRHGASARHITFVIKVVWEMDNTLTTRRMIKRITIEQEAPYEWGDKPTLQ